MKRNTKLFSLLGVCLLSLTSCKEDMSWAIGVTWTGRDSETVYNSLAGDLRTGTIKFVEQYFPNSWDTTTTFQAEDGQMIANLIDGLVDYNVYNELSPTMAKEVPTEENGGIKRVGEGDKQHFEITFEIKDGIYWVRNDTAEKTDELVKAEDWVTALKANLDYTRQSASYYMAQMFIQGATEYYTATKYQYYYESNTYGIVSSNGTGVCTPGSLSTTNSETCGSYVVPFKQLHTDKYQTIRWGLGDKNNTGATYTNEVIDSILNGDRLGVKADGNKLTYTLTGLQKYFVSVLTYTPFMPVPTNYFTQNKSTYGKNPKDMLSNGAYVVRKYGGSTSSELIFERNPHYYDPSSIKNNKIIIKRMTDGTVNNSYSRDLFEKGEIDAFTVSKADQKGWSKYVTGKDGSGSVQNPNNSVAFSSESVGNGSTYAFYLNAHRTTYRNSMMDSNNSNLGAWADGSSGNDLNLVQDSLTKSDQKIPSAVNNTNLALTFSPKIRQAILTSLDFTTFFRGRTQSYDSYQDRKTAVNSYTPHDFIKTTDGKADNGGTDYLDYLKVAYVDDVLLADSRNTAFSGKKYADIKTSDPAYAEVLMTAANDAVGYSTMGGLSLIQEWSNGKFTGFAKESGSSYQASTGIVNNAWNGFGNGSTLSLQTDENSSNQIWNKSASRQTSEISKLIEEGITEANENMKKAGINETIKTPIVIEYPSFEYDTTENLNHSMTINAINANLNGGKYIGQMNTIEQNQDKGVPSGASTISAKDAKVLVIHSTKGRIPSSPEYSTVSQGRNCNMLISGWGPDYADAKTYADTVKWDGDLALNYGYSSSDNELDKDIDAARKQSLTGDYDKLVEEADKMVSATDRAKAYAKAEIQLLFKQFLLRPAYMANQGINVTVRRTLPNAVTSFNVGLSNYKYKGYQKLQKYQKKGQALPSDTVKGIWDQLQAERNK